MVDGSEVVERVGVSRIESKSHLVILTSLFQGEEMMICDPNLVPNGGGSKRALLIGLDSGDIVSVNHKQVTDTFSDVLGRKIGYVNVPDDQYLKMMEPYVDSYVLEHLTDVFKFYRTANIEDESTFRVNDIVLTTTGNAPETFKQFITANKDAFAAPSPKMP